jgi:hypothetical protein
VAPQHTFLLFADANPGMKPCPKCSAQHGKKGQLEDRLSHQTFSEWRILQIAQLQSSLRQA